MKINLKEAKKRHKEKTGKTITFKKAAKSLWPDSNEETQIVNISKLINGKVSYIKGEHLKILANLYGCTIDFLMKEQ